MGLQGPKLDPGFLRGEIQALPGQAAAAGWGLEVEPWGSLALPEELKEAARSLGLRGWALWRRLLLPGTFPYLVTGLVTASGGTWNASIVAEVVQWGSTTLEATGLGSYIARWTLEEGSGPHLLLGLAVMSLYVVAMNRLLWRRLYRLAEGRFRL